MRRCSGPCKRSSSPPATCTRRPSTPGPTTTCTVGIRDNHGAYVDLLSGMIGRSAGSLRNDALLPGARGIVRGVERAGAGAGRLRLRVDTRRDAHRGTGPAGGRQRRRGRRLDRHGRGPPLHGARRHGRERPGPTRCCSRTRRNRSTSAQEVRDERRRSWPRPVGRSPVAACSRPVVWRQRSVRCWRRAATGPATRRQAGSATPRRSLLCRSPRSTTSSTCARRRRSSTSCWTSTRWMTESGMLDRG